MNKKNIKSLIIIFALTIFIIILLLPTSEDNMRIRVIANSDSTEDQNIKKEVVKIVQNYIKADDTQAAIKSKLSLLDNVLQEYSNGKFEIEVQISKTKFPPKTLDGVLVPGGNYNTLLIKIGEAKGSNYWTLLYPEYFGISFDDIYAGEVEVKWFLLELINS